MIFWAVLGFGLFLLLVVFLFPRLAFVITLLMLLSKSGWFDYFGKTNPSGTEIAAFALTVIFILLAAVGSLILDIYDQYL